MNDSFFFPTYIGLLTPEHRKNIGTAIWEFQWCISKTTKEIDSEDGKIGLVLGGKPVRLSEIAEDFGIDEKTVSRNLKRLEKYGYLQLIRAPYGFVIRVNKSKKFTPKRPDKNVHSPNKRDRTKMSDQTKMSTPDRTKMSARPDKNVRSNKDIKDINIKPNNNDDFWANIDNMDLTPEQQLEIEVEEYYQAKRRKHNWPATTKDRNWIKKAIEEGFTREEMIAGITKAFLDAGEVNSFEYCLKVMRTQRREREKWNRMKKERERQQHETRSEVSKHSGSAGSYQGNTSLDARVREQQERRLKELEAKYGV